MKSANISKNLNGSPDLFMSLHKLIGAEVAFDILFSTTIEEIEDVLPLAALQAKCIEHKSELQVAINTLAEFLNNTPLSLKVAAAFTEGTDIIYALGPCLQQPKIAYVLTKCHEAIIGIIKNECMVFSYPKAIHPFLLQSLSLHDCMVRELASFLHVK